ncbi:MAG: TonB-dependent receptor, partial [bacterium]|nr:TonB-dependent receptor [bacterium]
LQPGGAWLDWDDGRPVKNIGIFTLIASGSLMGEKLKATLGIRYDTQWFNFFAIDKQGKPEEQKSFSQLSPRFSLVFRLSEKVTLKGQAGRAFRAPSPTEMFGANTWTLASNLRQLEPEIVTTLEFALDWLLTKNLLARIDFFHTRFENQIAYSVQNNNLSTNIYTLTTAGIEAELMFNFDEISGFLNYTFARRLDEDIIDKTITESANRLTWAPAYVFNCGINYRNKTFNVSLQGHFQGKVRRRSSDFAEPQFTPYRPAEVAAWFSADAKIDFKLTPNLELSLSATNLFDSRNALVKNFSYPFDYRMMGRRILAGFKIKL